MYWRDDENFPVLSHNNNKTHSSTQPKPTNVNKQIYEAFFNFFFQIHTHPIRNEMK